MSLANKQKIQAELISEMRRVTSQQWLGNNAPVPAKRRVSGAFLNLPHLFLRWLPDGWFQYLPHPEPAKRFAFRRHTGETITPGLMFTSGSALPPEIVGEVGFDAARLAPALFIHDWLFDLRFSTAATKSFEEVEDVLVEAAMTLVDISRGALNATDLAAVQRFGSSPIARRAWDAGQGSTLPEQSE